MVLIDEDEGTAMALWEKTVIDPDTGLPVKVLEVRDMEFLTAFGFYKGSIIPKINYGIDGLIDEKIVGIFDAYADPDDFPSLDDALAAFNANDPLSGAFSLNDMLVDWLILFGTVAGEYDPTNEPDVFYDINFAQGSSGSMVVANGVIKTDLTNAEYHLDDFGNPVLDDGTMTKTVDYAGGHTSTTTTTTNAETGETSETFVSDGPWYHLEIDEYDVGYFTNTDTGKTSVVAPSGSTTTTDKYGTETTTNVDADGNVLVKIIEYPSGSASISYADGSSTKVTQTDHGSYIANYPPPGSGGTTTVQDPSGWTASS
ncbi:hypothetical protein JXB11_01465, partial [Candidatus Woesearchaeota archaeon]|nr:hypothetical protein [Candidatus Woesearchaeota archaeon]